MSLLELRNLRTYLTTSHGLARAVDGVDLVVDEGESVGVVGESGSGKSLLALSIMGLNPGGAQSLQEGSSIRYRGQELAGAAPGVLRRLRGREMAMVFQEPMTSLNPVQRVGRQIGEALALHHGRRGRELDREVLRLLKEVGIPDAEARAGAYPHELSGGMRQRVMIAMALAGDPALLVADEPTTALDVTVQAQILALLKAIGEDRGMSLILISHDLRVVSRICRRIVVMYGGQVMEAGATEAVLAEPLHPYTRGLLGSRLSIRDRRQSLRPIPGEVPEAHAWPSGCRFHPRCPAAVEECREKEPPMTRTQGRVARCWVPWERGS